MMPLTASERALALQRVPPPKKKRPPLTPGRVVYLLYYYPKHIWREGWSWHYHLWKGRRELARMLHVVRPAAPPSGPPLTLHYLTGRRYIPLTTTSLLSAQTAMGRPIQAVLYDDGSLDEAALAPLRRFFPAARVVPAATIETTLDRILPADKFPVLRRLRLSYIHLRKLTDIQTAPGDDWRIVLDSDVFFFRPPSQLLELVDRRSWCHMVDAQQSYGVPASFLESLAGAPLHPRVNVGLCHLDRWALDWEFIEDCAAAMLARHGFSYYLEQALVAVLMARAGAAPLDPANYLVYPNRTQGQSFDQAAVHYVDRSFLLLYRYAWRHVLTRYAAP